jgi:hypothetical protein
LSTSFHTPVGHWLQSHPIAATSCVLIILYKVYTWLFPDPIMKLPAAPGANLFCGHTLIVTEWVAQLLSNGLLSSSVVIALLYLPPFMRNMLKTWVGMYVYAGFIRCVDMLVYAARHATYCSYSGKPDFSRWTQSQYLMS